MTTLLLNWLIKIAAAVAKQMAVAATPVAIAVAGALAGVITTIVKMQFDNTLSAAEKKELMADAWDTAQTSIAVCIREGGMLAEDVVGILADTAAAEIKATLGF